MATEVSFVPALPGFVGSLDGSGGRGVQGGSGKSGCSAFGDVAGFVGGFVVGAALLGGGRCGALGGVFPAGALCAVSES